MIVEERGKEDWSEGGVEDSELHNSNELSGKDDTADTPYRRV